MLRFHPCAVGLACIDLACEAHGFDVSPLREGLALRGIHVDVRAMPAAAARSQHAPRPPRRLPFVPHPAPRPSSPSSSASPRLQADPEVVQCLRAVLTWPAAPAAPIAPPTPSPETSMVGPASPVSTTGTEAVPSTPSSDASAAMSVASPSATASWPTRATSATELATAEPPPATPARERAGVALSSTGRRLPSSTMACDEEDRPGEPPPSQRRRRSPDGELPPLPAGVGAGAGAGVGADASAPAAGPLQLLSGMAHDEAGSVDFAVCSAIELNLEVFLEKILLERK